MITLVQDALSILPDGPVYHYTSGSGLAGIIQSRAIWATNILYLNDATELLRATELAREQVRQLRTAYSVTDVGFFDEVDNLLSRILEFRGDSVYVCAFSEVDDDLSQWRGYCSDGNGFSIGFDLAQIAERLRQQDFRILKCVYNAEEHLRIIQNLLDEELDIFHRTQAIRPDSPVTGSLAAMHFETRFLQVAPSLKDKSFAAEREWRLVSRPIAPGERQIEFRQGKSMIIPYVKIGLSEPEELLDFTRIRVGPTPHPQLSLNSARQLLLTINNNHLPGCEFKVSSIPYRNW